ncbi:Dihydrofolate reductase [Strongyloides ratti]|uniref:dihydrofolate reductase n=1 Tax=Strongyloides ratti TaxID=34506 RepID=A0A090L1U3_STRRB|nr:Dihydrofolate reductase [Strongyloides ratti]CEF62087.1 Dihydrofolate reductase [Strongyloides ratti]
MCFKPRLQLIWAEDFKKGIGKNNTLPWDIPNEMAHFQKTTTTVNDNNKRNAVIMGRKCWESIPEKYRPLRKRLNIVLSRTMEPKDEKNLIITDNFDALINRLSTDEKLHVDLENVFVIGGSDIYNLALSSKYLSKLIVTVIENDFGCDVFAPSIDYSKFKLCDKREFFEGEPYKYTIRTYEVMENSF